METGLTHRLLAEVCVSFVINLRNSPQLFLVWRKHTGQLNISQFDSSLPQATSSPSVFDGFVLIST